MGFVYFLTGILIGLALGIFLMCLLQIGRENRKNRTS